MNTPCLISPFIRILKLGGAEAFHPVGLRYTLLGLCCMVT